MIQPLFNWRTALAIVAIAIVSGTIFYSQYLGKKIAREERQKVSEWAEAANLLVYDTTGISTRLAFMITKENQTIPIIWTNEKDSVVDHQNLDSVKAATDPEYVPNRLKKFKSENEPVIFIDPFDSTKASRYYYGHTSLLTQVQYYPYVQLLIVTLFIVITITALSTSFRSTQNQVWAGMAKETAHQLGTPLTSLQGWVEMLKEDPGSENIIKEMEKDVDRLKLVSDRFGKIGSAPQLEKHNVVKQVETMVDYMRKRATGRVTMGMETAAPVINASINPPLFDWVIENLLKNALDALEGKGIIAVRIQENEKEVIVDVADNGKGISKKNINKVFKPGFTTKKRGWGLGLSLSRRIIELYHRGQLYVKQSDPGKGTIFRIVLKK